MRVEYLSDHAGDMFRDSEGRRLEAARDRDLAESRHRDAEAGLRATRKSKPVWKRVLSVPSAEERHARRDVEATQRRFDVAFGRQRQLEHRVQQRGAGVRGEDKLTAVLDAALTDDWTMLRGYRNQKGEADHVLVGPSGVWAIEAKNRNAQLHVDGDRWFYNKLDRWGNVVERAKPATDNRMRSWGRQVGDVAGALAAWLERNQQPITIHTAVILVHHRASLGGVRNPGVDVVSANPEELLRAMHISGPVLSPDRRSAIVELIRRDHRHHEKRRKKRT